MAALQLYGGHNVRARSQRGVAEPALPGDLPALKPVLDSKHVDNVNAVTQRGGPQMIRDLIDVCDALSKDSYVVGRQTTAESQDSSIKNPAACQRGRSRERR